MNPSDETLAQRFRRGDEDAFRQLFDRHLMTVHGYCLRILRDPSMADDAAQETFIRVLQKFELYDSALPFKPWLIRVASNVALNIARGQRRHASLDIDYMTEETAADVQQPISLMEHAEDIETFQRAFDELPVKERMLLDLKFYQELPTEEITRILDISREHLSIRIYRAKQALRKQFVRQQKS